MRVADGVRASSVRTSLRRLSLLRDPLKRLMLQSHSEGAVGVSLAKEVEILLDHGAPLAWARVALTDGANLSYPGHQGLPPGYDAREEPWYRLATTDRGPQWGNPQLDRGDLGLMLPCSMGIYDNGGVFLGVAGVEITLDDLIDDMLDDDVISRFDEAFLVTGDGGIVVRSSERGKADVSTLGRTRAVRLRPYADLEVRKAVEARDAGHLLVSSTEGEQLVVHYRMDSVGWHYVLVGSAERLLDQKTYNR